MRFPVVLVALAAVGLTGCGTPDIIRDDTPVASYPDDGTNHMAALLYGTLRDLDGCYVVQWHWGSDTALPMFPRSHTQFNAETGVLTYYGRDYRPGDTIAVGGGGVETPSGDGLRIPSACAEYTSSAFMVQGEPMPEGWTPSSE